MEGVVYVNKIFQDHLGTEQYWKLQAILLSA